MKRTKVVTLLETGEVGAKVLVQGWVRTRRDAKDFSFMEVNDGSCQRNIQVMIQGDGLGVEVKNLTTGCSVGVEGTLVESPGKGQRVELVAEHIVLYGEADPATYPLQKKGHTYEFLRSISHLRVRTNALGAVFRIRNAAADAVHRFFQDRGFVYLHSPIITGADCEGAGEMFQVTTLPLTKVPLKNGAVDFDQDFFGQQASLTVSGQLQAETVASALCEVYTFGPTFRAENSNTPRHLAEFWMIEPEVAFADLDDNITLATDFIKGVVSSVMSRCAEDLEFLNKWVDKSLLATLTHVRDEPFGRMTYTEAVDVLLKSGKTFEFPVSWGVDLQSEHERYLTEEYLKRPLVLTDYPKDIKAFYMRLNDDGKTVRAMDVLVPRIGEIIGGSQREERYAELKARMEQMNLPLDAYQWYLDLRRFGTVPHSGFGMGFERLLMFLTGMTNIRDVIPFPRSPRHLDL